MKKKVLVSIGSNTFFAIKYCKFAKKVLAPILTSLFFHRCMGVYKSIWWISGSLCAFMRVYGGFIGVWINMSSRWVWVTTTVIKMKGEF